jgi:hypothetical protein
MFISPQGYAEHKQFAVRRGITAKGQMPNTSDLIPKMPGFCLVLDWYLNYYNRLLISKV